MSGATLTQGYEFFDFRHPDYGPIFQERAERLQWLRQHPEALAVLKGYYKDHVPQFISDWGCTFDPMRMTDGVPSVIPFILFDRQVEWVDWILESWKLRRPGVNPKSRESGVSWLAIATACSLGLFYNGMAIGFGSRKAEYVDKIGAPKSLFWKARMFLELLPEEFNNGFDPTKDAPEMRIMLRKTNSFISGEGGDGIGRGDRTSLYVVDESAYLEHPDDVDAALSQTTQCRIDVSTANGLGGPFHDKVIKWPSERVFRFHWRDDPRKDEEWYQKQVDELDPVVLASEVDIDFAASVEGVLIPSAWVQAAIDSHIALGIHPTGLSFGALDVADEGKDQNAFVGAHGILVNFLEEWSGKGDDLFGTTERAFKLCDDNDYTLFRYDADGIGASVRGDARVLNEKRDGGKRLKVEPYRGSAAVDRPKAQDVKGRFNEDYFSNLKAQCWWSLRTRFYRTYRAVRQGAAYEPDQIISLSSGLPTKLFTKLVGELSQPTFSLDGSGHVKIDKAPDGSKSPNIADGVVIRYAPVKHQMVVSKEAVNASRRIGAHARFIRGRTRV